MKEIVDAMREHSRIKAEAKRNNLELMKLAVQTGLPQEEAMKINLSMYLDGYLMALGHMPAHRRGVAND